MKPRLLVVTTVHHPDDNRIREKTIRSLQPMFDVTYAARSPGPSEEAGLQWHRLAGSRARRNAAAWSVAFRGRFDVVSLHDPELLPLALALSWTRRSRVVFDVHEDIPAQILTKEWLPPWARRPLAFVVRSMLRTAERTMTLTLAEESYGRIFDRPHVVLANYPDVDELPRARSDGRGAVYVGDVTESRGLLDAVAACGKIGITFEIVGPCTDGMRAAILTAAEQANADVTVTGRLPHGEAMSRVAAAAVALSPLRDIPNYRHSIPTKVLEYLAVGVPVAASDLPATRELIDGLDAVALHRPGDATEIAAAIERVWDADVAAAARAQADNVRATFRWPEARIRAVYTSPSV